MLEDKKNDTTGLAGAFCTEDLLRKVGGNLFQLVRVAAKRALELDAGKPALISGPLPEKLTTLALEEISQGKVVYKNNKMKEMEEK